MGSEDGAVESTVRKVRNERRETTDFDHWHWITEVRS